MLHHALCRGSPVRSISSGRVPGLEGSTYLDVEVRVLICSHGASILNCAFPGLSKALAKRGASQAPACCISSDDLATQPSFCPLAVSPREEISQGQTQQKGRDSPLNLGASGLRWQQNHQAAATSCLTLLLLASPIRPWRDCCQGPWCCWRCSRRKSGSCEWSPVESASHAPCLHSARRWRPESAAGNHPS